MRRFVPADRLAGLGSHEHGLTLAEVATRRARYGSNDIVETPPGGWRDVLRETIKDPMIWFLAGTSALFALVGSSREALIMLVAIAPIVGMDGFLHRRTQASTQGLRSRLAERATVIRDGAQTRIAATDVVPGDLALVATGEPFPADGLIVAGEALQADESALTGEAFPVRKDSLEAASASVGDARVNGSHWGFAGTRLLTGSARLRIVDTGAGTLYGEIVRSAVHGKHERTLLQREIANLVRALLVVAGTLCVILAWIRLRQGNGVVDALVSAVTLAVAAIPEEFPIVFTFFLGVGIFRLARRKALVRRAVVVENIGRVSCICSDKTGTLTEGRIRVGHYAPAEGVESGELARIAALASRREGADPLDAAILDEAASACAGYERLVTYPFTENRRRETAVFRKSLGGFVVASKGAPETILDLCRLGDAERALWNGRIRELAETGHKVIACAWRELTTDPSLEPESDRDYRLAGILGCEDAVRTEAAEAVRQAQGGGIHVIMITGDHPTTATAVAREVGIGGAEPTTIEGDRLEETIARGGHAALRQVDVIARALPAQKLALVQALQSYGEIVAVTGDGVNDVPALQAADVGIAMGERGTRSAREVAAIVLLDDNFRTIVSAIAEGRQLFRNLRLSFAYLLITHIALVVTATLIPLAGYPLLYLPINIVWLELLIHPTALLAFQHESRERRLQPMGRAERSGRFFSAWQWLIVGTAGTAATLVVMWCYDRSLGSTVAVEHARTMALVALVIAGALCAATLSGLRSPLARWITFLSVASAVLLVQVPALAELQHLAPLHLDDWLLAAGTGAVPAALATAFHWEGPAFLAQLNRRER